MLVGQGAGPLGPAVVTAAVVLLSGVGPAHGSEDIVVGCGGFVKSDVEINYSLIEIKLYTKHGTLKYQTDCAPNNGYFMIPLYDKGDFILKIEPPLGWSFEPKTVELHVDGVSDICTKGGDINFVFTGFSVNGKVLSKGQPLGPAGVQVSLRNTGTEAKIQSTVTQPGGKFAFFKVLPGDYEILATHPTWALKEDVLGCNVSPVPGFQPQDESLVYLCYTVSREDGSFSFYSLPSGGYTVIPFYRGERITFDVAPSRLDFTVEHDSLKIEPVFHVMGFSVTGRVLNGPEGDGVPEAVVTLNNQIKVKTKADGSFRLENITTGTYTIHAQKEHLYFETVTIKIAPNTPQLADIIATGFSVCGQISIIRFPDTVKQMNKYKVVLSSQDKDKSLVTVETDAHGSFCFKAKPGTYKVQVMVPEAETRAGLTLKPQTFPLTVTDRPVMDVAFVQFLASVSGKVSCLDTCGDLLVTLQSLSRQGEKRSLQLSGKVNAMTFTFDNVLPGKYKISIMHEDWCWKNKSLEVEVLEDDVSAVEFRQTGYMLRCSLSHAITLGPSRELVCRSCLKQTLHKLEAMMRILQAETTAGTVTPTAIGDSILNITGDLIHLASSDVRAPQPSELGAESPSRMVASQAYNLTSALMRILTRSRVLNEEHLTLAGEEIVAQGKCSDPRSLLCYGAPQGLAATSPSPRLSAGPWPTSVTWCSSSFWWTPIPFPLAISATTPSPPRWPRWRSRHGPAPRSPSSGWPQSAPSP
nr:BOS complex subunit NOMO3-like [Pan paniscus]